MKEKYYVYSPAFEEIDGPFKLKEAIRITKQETNWPTRILMEVIDEWGNEVK